MKSKWTYYAKSAAMYLTFGFASTAAGASFAEHPIAYVIMLLTVITIGLIEFNDGLDLGSEVANRVWRDSFDGAVKRILEKVS